MALYTYNSFANMNSLSLSRTVYKVTGKHQNHGFTFISTS